MRVAARLPLLWILFGWQIASWTHSGSNREVTPVGVWTRIAEKIRAKREFPPPPAVASDQLLETRLNDSRRRREETFRRAPEISKLTSKLHAEERANHFGEAMAEAMRRNHA